MKNILFGALCACVLGVAPVSAQVYDFQDSQNLGVVLSPDVNLTPVYGYELGNGFLSAGNSGAMSFQFVSPSTLHAVNLSAFDSTQRVYPAGDLLANIAIGTNGPDGTPAGGTVLHQQYIDLSSTDFTNWLTVLYPDIAGVDWVYIAVEPIYALGGDGNYAPYPVHVSVDNVTTVDAGVIRGASPVPFVCRPSLGKGRGVPGGKACLP